MSTLSKANISDPRLIHVNIILLALFHVLSVHLLLGEAVCCVSDLSLSFQVLWDCHLGLYFSGTNQYCYHYYHVFFFLQV